MGHAHPRAMARAEVLHWLHVMKWVVVDNTRLLVLPGQVEDAERFVLRDPELAKGYASRLLQPGQRGRITLVLIDPYEARALATLVGLLRALETP